MSTAYFPPRTYRRDSRAFLGFFQAWYDWRTVLTNIYRAIGAGIRALRQSELVAKSLLLPPRVTEPQFTVADIHLHRAEVLDLNVEDVSPASAYAETAIEKICERHPPDGIFYLVKVDGVLAAMGGLRGLNPERFKMYFYSAIKVTRKEALMNPVRTMQVPFFPRDLLAMSFAQRTIALRRERGLT